MAEGISTLAGVWQACDCDRLGVLDRLAESADTASHELVLALPVGGRSLHVGIDVALGVGGQGARLDLVRVQLDGDLRAGLGHADVYVTAGARARASGSSRAGRGRGGV